jgi:serine/threonine-protein kinase
MKALALDDTLSTAHWAFGWSTWVTDWDLDTCETEIRRAIQLNPSDEHAHAANSIFIIATTDNQAQAEREMRLALDLDPLSEYVNANLAWIYLFIDDYGRASEQARRTLELFPGSPLAYLGLGIAESCRCRHAEAIEALNQAAAISHDPLPMAYLACAHARAGNRRVASEILAGLLSRSKDEAVTPRCFVLIKAAIGERDRAFEWIEKAYAARDSGLFFMRVMPLYDPLQSDSRFGEMLRRLGIPRN